MASNTVFSAYNLTKEKLKNAQIEDFGFEARVILRYVTGLDNKEIMMNYNTPLSEFAQRRLDDIVLRRTARYPLQYILGEWSFYGLNYKVGEGVLIPRADSESVVDTALKLIKSVKNPRVLDLCAGSGALGISIAANRRDSKVLLLEKYEAAAKYLKENIKLNAPDNAEYINGDVFKGDFAENDCYDLIISNPPYIKHDDLKGLQSEVLYEPRSALDGGEDGLRFYRAIIENYKHTIKKGGKICFEVGAEEAGSVCKMLKEAAFSEIGTKRDLNGIERVVFGTVK